MKFFLAEKLQHMYYFFMFRPMWYKAGGVAVNLQYLQYFYPKVKLNHFNEGFYFFTIFKTRHEFLRIFAGFRMKKYLFNTFLPEFVLIFFDFLFYILAHCVYMLQTWRILCVCTSMKDVSLYLQLQFTSSHFNYLKNLRQTVTYLLKCLIKRLFAT